VSGFHDVLANIALIVGGTQPDATNERYFYSGVQKGDGSGISGINGCFSAPPFVVNCDPPFGVVLLGTGTDGGDLRGPGQLWQGTLLKTDMVRLQICVGLTDISNQYDTLIGFRDTVPATLAGKMTLNSTANLIDAFPGDYRFAHVTWASTPYQCLEFHIRVRRDVVGQTYTA
jgi:hypothetical protein